MSRMGIERIQSVESVIQIVVTAIVATLVVPPVLMLFQGSVWTASPTEA